MCSCYTCRPCGCVHAWVSSLLVVIESSAEFNPPYSKHWIDSVSRNLRSLNSLEIDADAWDIIIIHLMWKECRLENKLPSRSEFKSFLKGLEGLEYTQPAKYAKNNEYHQQSCSQSNIISSEFFTKLQLETTTTNLSVVGTNGVSSSTLRCFIQIQSFHCAWQGLAVLLYQ